MFKAKKMTPNFMQIGGNASLRALHRLMNYSCSGVRFENIELTIPRSWDIRRSTSR